MTLVHLFQPRAVAVVGSTSHGKLGYELIRQIVEGGYHDVFAVNPRAQGVFGAPGYPIVTDIGQPVDLAIIASPTSTVSDVLRDSARAGVKAAVIITSGFSEAGNASAETEISRVARQHGIRFVGPNCAGIVNTRHQLFATLETRPPEGGAALIAQSGAVGGVFLAWAKEFGLGVSKFVSYGNGADVNERDLLRYLAKDDDTRVVALYIESVLDGREFIKAAQACAERKPLVVMKAGRTSSGKRATLSHTGSLAGADVVYDAALRQCGAIRVHAIEEMFDVCKGFLYSPSLKGRRVAIVTNSGGPGVLAADRAEEVGLDVAEPSPEARARLAEFLPPQCAIRNPFDLTVEGTEEGYRNTLSVVLQEYDAVLALDIAPPYLDSVPLARGISDAAAQSDKPVVASFLPREVVSGAIAFLQNHGVPNFATGERAVAALARMAERQTRTATVRRTPVEPLSPDAKTLPGEGQMLEPEAMAWLHENGLPVPAFRFAAARYNVVPGCRAIGYPVVIKIVSPVILHKSDCGGVILDVRDDGAALAAFDALERIATGHDFRGVVVYPLIREGVEVLLGLSRDPQFGPVVAFGLGGVYTEVWKDVALRVAPIDRVEADAMIREVSAFPLLAGVRGQAPRDLGALADVLVKFSYLPFRYPEIGEVDLNPVFLFSRGLVVGDARVIRRGDAIEQVVP